MMGIVTLLLQSGAVLAVALILGLYNELSSRSGIKLEITQPTYEPIHEPQTTSKPTYKDESPPQTPTTGRTYRPQKARISEAPAPFADESFSPHKFQIPTDVTATSNVLTPSVGTAPVLIIPVPKKRRAARSDPSKSNTPSRRRASRQKHDMIGTGTPSEQPNVPTQRQN